MRQDCLSNLERLDEIRRANRRRPVSVVEVSELTPHMQRITLNELQPDATDTFRPADWIKLYVPCSGRGRQHGRAYTVRDRSDGNIVLDMAIHGGLCASWAQNARPGDHAEISGPRKGFKLDWPPGDVMLAADETGLPAVASILAGLPDDAKGTVWLEVANDADIQTLDAPPQVTVHYLPRKADLPGRRLIEAARRTPVQPTTTVWVAAERTAALDLRDHFEARLPREQISTSGYWRMPRERSPFLSVERSA